MNQAKKQFIEINKRIFGLRDGLTLDKQKEYGMSYQKSLGLPIVSLREIAKDYATSHELATLLWQFGGREQLIMSTLLDDPNLLTLDLLEERLSQIPTKEILEQFAGNLLIRLENPLELFTTWICSTEIGRKQAAALLYGHLLRIQQLGKTETLLLAQQLNTDSYLRRVGIRALETAAFREKHLRQALSSFLEKELSSQIWAQELLNTIATFDN